MHLMRTDGAYNVGSNAKSETVNKLASELFTNWEVVRVHSRRESQARGIPADADETPALATVATSENYADLDGKPTLGALAAKDSVAIADLSATGTPSTATFLRGDNTWGTVAGAGTVTSVAMSVPTGFSAAGSPTAGSGVFAVSYSFGYQGYSTAEANKLLGITAEAQVNTVDTVNIKTGAVVLNSTDVGALPAGGGVGIGQIWQALRTSRSVGISCQNTTGRPVQVGIIIANSSSIVRNMQISQDNITWVIMSGSSHVPAGIARVSIQPIVSDGWCYRVDWS